MTSVIVRRATLRWNTPVQDGDPLGGFHIFWGDESDHQAHTITVDANTRSQIIDLPGPGTYYFSMAAFDVNGVESARSNEVSKVIPG